MAQPICLRSCCIFCDTFAENTKAQIISLVAGSILIAIGIFLCHYAQQKGIGGPLPLTGRLLATFGSMFATAGLLFLISNKFYKKDNTPQIINPGG